MSKRPRYIFSFPSDIVVHIFNQLVGSSWSVYAVGFNAPREADPCDRVTTDQYWSALVCRLRLVSKATKVRVASLFATMCHSNQFVSFLNLDAFAHSHLSNPSSRSLTDAVRVYFHVVWTRYHRCDMLIGPKGYIDAVAVMTAFSRWYGRVSPARKAVLHGCKPFWNRLAFILGEPQKVLALRHKNLSYAVANATVDTDEHLHAQKQLDDFESLGLLTPSDVLRMHCDS